MKKINTIGLAFAVAIVGGSIYAFVQAKRFIDGSSSVFGDHATAVLAAGVSAIAIVAGGILGLAIVIEAIDSRNRTYD